MGVGGAVAAAFAVDGEARVGFSLYAQAAVLPRRRHRPHVGTV